MSGLEPLQPRPLGDGLCGFSTECFSFLRLGDTFLSQRKRPRAFPRVSARRKGRGWEGSERKAAWLGSVQGHGCRGAGSIHGQSAAVAAALAPHGAKGRLAPTSPAGSGASESPFPSRGAGRGWNVLGPVDLAPAHAGTRGLGTRMCWDPWSQCWDTVGSTAPALGRAGIHKPTTGSYWVHSSQDILGPMAVTLELAGTLVPGVGTCWMPLGQTGIHGLYIGACWSPCPWHWDILGAQLLHWEPWPLHWSLLGL